MNRMWKRGLAVALCAAMGAGMLTGCGKKTQAAMVTFDGEAVDNDLVTFLFRYQEAAFDESYGSMFSQYYGGANVWEMDLTGTGETYGETFRTQFQDSLEQMLVAQKHASDFDITLSDEDETAIADAADRFIGDNEAVTLEKMSADRETVIRALEMETIMSRVEAKVAETADTEVSDEEAAQRSVDYICYTPTTETESETDTELSVSTESELSAVVSQTEAETQSAVTPAAAQSETAVETESGAKTKSQDSVSSETEAAVTGAAGTEAEAATEAQTETEDPAMAAAREKYRAMAESELSEIQSSTESFADISTEISDEGLTGVSVSSFTFGKDDSYPDAAIIEATNDLADDTLVDHVVEANGSYYILHVDKALDEDATAGKKEQIISERKQTAIDDQYTEWEKDVTFEVDSEAFAALEYDRIYNAPETSATETDASAQTGSEGAASTERETEASTESEAALSAGSESTAEGVSTEAAGTEAAG